MIHVRATEAKNKFGQMLDNAQHEAVLIEKNGRDIAVVLSNSEYQRLRVYEDELWGLKAQLAKNEGFHSEGESETLLESFLDDKD